MPQNRFYTPNDLSEGNTVFLEEDEFRHLLVMRPRPGDEIELINGRGTLAKCTLSHLEKKRAIIDIVSSDTQKPPSFTCILAQGIPKASRLDTIIEKGTELGMTELWLFPAGKSEKTSINSSRIEKITIAAAKQSGRLYLPKISLKDPLLSWKSLPLPSFFGDPNPENLPFISAWNLSPPQNGILFFIGPESGFTGPEEAHLKSLGSRPVLLHENVLRTDTAPLAALAQIHGALLSSMI